MERNKLNLEEQNNMLGKQRRILEQKPVAAIGIDDELPVGDLLLEDEAVRGRYHVVILLKRGGGVKLA